MNPAESVSRRGFFGHAVGATAAGIGQAIGGAAGHGIHSPPQAWIIMCLAWQYDDEYSFQEGEFACGKVYFNKPEAETDCRALCETFFQESPEEFGVRWDEYALDPDTATWADLREAGFPDPYYVMELES